MPDIVAPHGGDDANDLQTMILLAFAALPLILLACRQRAA
jgi:hypothetical protein